MQIGLLEFIFIVAIIVATIALMYRKQGKTDGTAQMPTDVAPTPSSTYQAPVVHRQVLDKGDSPVATPRLYEHYLRFLYAVAVIQDTNGQGSVRIKRNENGSTLQLFCHYCNYSCVSCRNKLTQDGALRFPELQIIPGDEDSISYNHEAIPFENWEFTLRYLMQEFNTALPSAIITGQTVREDFIGVQFRT